MRQEITVVSSPLAATIMMVWIKGGH